MLWIKLYIVDGEIRDRVVREVGVTYDTINYNSPVYTRETSKMLTYLLTPLSITKLEKDILFINNKLNAL